MNKKKIIVFAILILIIGIAIFVKYYYLYANCKDTENGWECKFITEAADKVYEKKCENQGGVWRCYGWCFPDYEHYCDFPFDDAGKECTNSQQCKGKCVIDSKYVQQIYPNRTGGEDIVCKTDCVGKCAEYPLRHCDWWFEVNNSVVEDHTLMLCD
jgi:hypothetical protein